jgi:hypothetical protein
MTQRIGNERDRTVAPECYEAVGCTEINADKHRFAIWPRELFVLHAIAKQKPFCPVEV